MDRYGYTYDRNSNRLTRTNALAAAFSETYAYDALNQLQSFTRSGGTTTSQQWQFDALGNWTTVTTNGVAQARTANAQNELTQVGGSTLAYSTTGNLTTDAQGRTLSYDAWNRLISVKNGAGTEVARYEYDGLNRRIVEQVGTLASPAAATAPIRDVYYSQDWQALEERVRTSPSQVAATADTRFIWSPVYVDAMVARDRNADGNATTGTGGLEQRVYALQDANWNTTAIIAATGVPGVSAGTVINRFAYTPYGEVQTLTASWATPPAGSTPAVPWAHLFQGLEFTDVTALAYVRHRDYSATLGRFIELDPIGFSAGDNNWYRFVANGPTVSTDASGLGAVKGSGGTHKAPSAPSKTAPPGSALNPGDIYVVVYVLKAYGNRNTRPGIINGYGHAFIRVGGIEDGRYQERIRGFWPTDFNRARYRDCPHRGKVQKDYGEEYTEQWEFVVRKSDKPNLSALKTVFAYMDEYDRKHNYDLDDKNCVTFVLDVLRFIGADIPEGFAAVRFTEGDQEKNVLTPNAACYDIRKLTPTPKKIQ